MRFPQRLWAVVLFALMSMVALVLSGVLDWITSVLFLGIEFLAESLRPLLGNRHKKLRSHSPLHDQVHPSLVSPAKERRRRPPLRRGRSKSYRGTLCDAESAPPPAKVRILVPLNHDRPGLITFAIRECQERRAELIILFLRPIGYTPMGPNPIPTLAEDDRAQALIDRIATEAEEAHIPLRVRYEVCRDMPGTILEVARTLEADILLMEATRRNLLWRAIMGDHIQSILMHLPQSVSLLLHTA